MPTQNANALLRSVPRTANAIRRANAGAINPRKPQVAVATAATRRPQLETTKLRKDAVRMLRTEQRIRNYIFVGRKRDTQAAAIK